MWCLHVYLSRACALSLSVCALVNYGCFLVFGGYMCIFIHTSLARARARTLWHVVLTRVALSRVRVRTCALSLSACVLANYGCSLVCGVYIRASSSLARARARTLTHSLRVGKLRVFLWYVVCICVSLLRSLPFSLCVLANSGCPGCSLVWSGYGQ